MQATQSQAQIPKHVLYGAITLWTTIQQPITPWPGTRQLGTTHMPQSPLKLFKLANPKPVCPASLILSLGNHNKCSCPQFPLSLCLLTKPSGFPPSPHGMPNSLLLRSVGITNYLFNSSCLLMRCPSYT